MKRAMTLFAVTVFILVFSIAWAVPGLINYQGKLTDNSGEPLTGSHSIRFDLFDSSTGGSSLWNETQNVTVTTGMYDIHLGSATTLPQTLFAANDILYLQVSVRNSSEVYEALIPRQRLTSASYAFHAVNADTLGGETADAYALSVHLHDDRYYTETEANTILSGKANVGHLHDERYFTESETTTLLGGKANLGHLHDERYFTESETNTLLGGKANVGHLHDERYYTETEADTRLNTKANLAHVHSGGDITSGTIDLSSGLTGPTIRGTNSNSIGTGVYGSATGAIGRGVYGYASNTGDYSNYGGYFIASGASGTGVYGSATGAAGRGVYGLAPNTGVYGESIGTNGMGVYGTGNTYGVYGNSTGTSGIGVYGIGTRWAGYFAGDLFTRDNVGIGTTSPNNKLHVIGDLKVTGDDGFDSAGDEAMLSLSNVTGQFYIKSVYGDGLKLGAYAAADGIVLKESSGNVGIGTSSPAEKLDVNGTLQVKVLKITGGADIAEPFSTERVEAIEAGMVMAIDEKNPGKLKMSDQAYDRKVAGIVSGAGGINPGMLLSQENSAADGSIPLALTGRVYCLADATQGAIEPGDLLTSSDRPGHAMKVSDFGRSSGATIGKAMTSLGAGTGLVLVLVSLQ